MKSEARSKQAARRAVRIKRRIQIFVILAALAGIAAFIFYAPFFNISSVYVVRADVNDEYKISDEEVLSASGIVMGKNIFATDISKVKASIMKLPYAQSAEVQRVFPNKLKIILDEAARAACVRCENGYALIGMDGRILEIIETNEDCGVPMLAGFDIVGAELGQAVPSEGNPVFAASLKLLKLLGDNELLMRTKSINTSDLNNMEIMIGDRVQILVGDADDLDYRMKFIKKVMDEKLSPYESVTLDYRASDLSVRSYKAPDKPAEETDGGENKDSENGAKEEQGVGNS